MISLSLLVLRAKEPDALVSFYEKLGLLFVREKHGSGPFHHAAVLGKSVLEIYPAGSDGRTTSETRIGLAVPSLSKALKALGVGVKPYSSPWGLRAVLSDPAGHRLELMESVEIAEPPTAALAAEP